MAADTSPPVNSACSTTFRVVADDCAARCPRNSQSLSWEEKLWADFSSRATSATLPPSTWEPDIRQDLWNLQMHRRTGVHMEMVIHEKRYIRREHTESSAKSGGHPQRGVYTEEITRSGIL